MEDVTANLQDLSISEEGFPSLLDLPQTVIKVLLKKLSIWTLMDLRLTCKTTKSWVEDVSLDRFLVHVKSHSQLKELCDSNNSTPWSSILLLCDGQSNYDIRWIQNPLYGEMLQKLSPSLTTLKFSNQRLPFSGLRDVLSFCTGLRDLEIGTLWCGGGAVDCMESDKKEFPNFVKTLASLEGLAINLLAWDKEEDLVLFDFLLKHSSNLQRLKVPHILMANFMHSSDEDEEEMDRKYLNLISSKLVNPVVSFLGTRKKDCKSQKRYLDVENVHHTELFPRMAKACHSAGVKLLNVSEAFENPATQEEETALQMIESLLGFTAFLDFNKLSALKAISLDTETSADSDVNEPSVSVCLPTLKSVSFCLPEDISPNLLKFLGVRRPSVECLSIEFQAEETKLPFLFPITFLTNNYQQLTSLTLIEWAGQDDDLIQIFSSLGSLVNLKLQGCPNITDRGFLGEDPKTPAVLNLRGLKHLWIDCHISNAVLQNAISQMSLESLYYSSDAVTLPGFLSLSQGPIISTLVSFQVLPPENCKTEVLDKFISYFKNLKRGPLSPITCHVKET